MDADSILSDSIGTRVNQIRKNADQLIMQVATHEIMDAMAPFKPGLVTYHAVDRGPDTWLQVRCSTLPNDIFETNGMRVQILDVYDIGDWLGTEAGKFFRSRMDEAVPDNVILGSD